MHNLCFESTIVKIQDVQYRPLRIPERKKSLDCFQNWREGFQKGDVADNSIVEHRGIRLRGTESFKRSQHLDKRLSLLMCNMCEQFFTTDGYAVTNHRKGSKPSNCKAQRFSYMYYEFWSSKEVTLDLKQISEAMTWELYGTVNLVITLHV